MNTKSNSKQNCKKELTFAFLSLICFNNILGQNSLANQINETTNHQFETNEEKTFLIDLENNLLVQNNAGLTININANENNITGGGIAVSDDGGFFDFNDGAITYKNLCCSGGLKIDAKLTLTDILDFNDIEDGGLISARDRLHIQTGNGGALWLNPFSPAPVIIGGPGGAVGLEITGNLEFSNVIDGGLIASRDRLHIQTGSGGALWLNPFSSGKVIVGGPGSPGELSIVSPLGGKAFLEVDGVATVDVLEITGGADMCERFSVTPGEKAPIPGSVVSYDEVGNQSIKVSRQEYDKKVAGVVSGADGINPGIKLGQAKSLADGVVPVAFSGRVRCLADATYAPIAVGDLMTSSPTPGHAMKVIEMERSAGAVIGKSTSRLDSGLGFIWLHVTIK